MSKSLSKLTVLFFLFFTICLSFYAQGLAERQIDKRNNRLIIMREYEQEMVKLEEEYRVRTDKKSYAAELMKLADKLMQKNMFGQVYDIAHLALKYDVNNKAAAKLLKLSWDDAQKKLLTPLSKQMNERGFEWDSRFGWVLKNSLSEYEKGRYYVDGKWLSLDELNLTHRNWENPWIIETDHFIVHAATDLKNGVISAEHAEIMYKAWVREFIDFFGEDGGDRLFDQKAYDKFKIIVLHDQKMFEDFIDEKFANDFLKSGAGFYYRETHTMYLYPYRGLIKMGINHECTHQLFAEMARGEPAEKMPAVSEGLANYMQFGKVVDGRFVLRVEDNITIVQDKFKKSLMEFREELGMHDLWHLSKDDFYGSGGRSALKYYGYAGSVVHFYMHHENGLYAPEFMDFVADFYNGELKGNIYEYIGVAKEKIIREYDRWLEDILAKY
ncbi:hypothetical protein ACFLT2_04115 [Acidobacteriota bacterium]